jgi:hypothetical protein
MVYIQLTPHLADQVSAVVIRSSGSGCFGNQRVKLAQLIIHCG